VVEQAVPSPSGYMRYVWDPPVHLQEPQEEGREKWGCRSDFLLESGRCDHSLRISPLLGTDIDEPL